MKTMNEKRLRNLKLVYGIALAVIAMTMLSSSFLMQYALKRTGDDSRVINLSGRQRMLSQRLTKCVLALEYMATVDDRARGVTELTESFASWKQAHLGLQRGDEKLMLPQRENSPAVRALFAEMEPFHVAMVNVVEGLVKEIAGGGLDPVALRTAADLMLANEPRFLVLMDKITFLIDKESKERISSLQRLEKVFLVIGLLVLVFEFFVVFRPSLSQLDTMMMSLKRRNDELEEAIKRINRLEGIIPICMYCKKIRDDGDSWQQLEKYLSEHSEALFSHGICPDCFAKNFEKPEQS